MTKKHILIVSSVIVLIAILGWQIGINYFKQEKFFPKRGDVIESIYGLGTVAADQVFNVRLGIAITVNKLYVKEGDLVKRGDQLIKIDNTIMRAPIDGTITKVAYKEGELVAPQVTIVTVTNLRYLYLEVNLEQQSVLRIKEGQSVYISFETLRNKKYTGKIKTVYPRENQFIVRIELDQWPIGVLPGMTADVAIMVGEKKNVLLIPVNSISSGHVTRLRNSKKEKISVQLGVISDEWAEVVSGNISETDELVIRKK